LFLLVKASFSIFWNFGSEALIYLTLMILTVVRAKVPRWWHLTPNFMNSKDYIINFFSLFKKRKKTARHTVPVWAQNLPSWFLTMFNFRTEIWFQPNSNLLEKLIQIYMPNPCSVELIQNSVEKVQTPLIIRSHETFIQGKWKLNFYLICK
jgi:hypothetical protein